MEQLMNPVKTILLSSILIFGIACDNSLPITLESKVQDKAWDSFKEKLKSPSTAKLVSFEPTEIKDDESRLKYYLDGSPAFQESIKIIKEYAVRKSISKGRIDIIQIYEKEAAKELYDIEPSNKHSKECVLKLGKVADSLRQKYTNQFNTDKSNIRLFICTFSYDAQNAYGAMLRGKAVSVVMCGKGYAGSIDIVLDGEAP
jgi:hypothetical protein